MKRTRLVLMAALMGFTLAYPVGKARANVSTIDEGKDYGY